MIKTEIVHHLVISCPNCGISDDIIDRQSFSCFEESSSLVTYRARLEGTSETESNSLISLIDEWVRGGGASIIVTGVAIKMGPNCQTATSSLSEPKRSHTPPSLPQPSTTHTLKDPADGSDTDNSLPPSHTSATDNNAAIIGGAVAGFVPIAIIGIIGIAVVLRKFQVTTMSTKRSVKVVSSCVKQSIIH